jgi:hypothetical protein
MVIRISVLVLVCDLVLGAWSFDDQLVIHSAAFLHFLKTMRG